MTRKTCVGAVLFTFYYGLFLMGIQWTAAGYIERVWNLYALSGIRIGNVPFEELLFAAAFGAYWSGVYEHITWWKLAPPATQD